MAMNADTFAEAEQPTRMHLTLPLPEGCAPLDLSDIPPDTDISTYYAGLEILGVPETPQGVQVAGVIEAVRDDGRPLYKRTAVQFSRRSAKTTSIAAVILGRMQTREKYRVASTAQTGKIARSIWMEVVQALDVAYAEVADEDRPYHVRLSNGDERITWKATGSFWEPKPPTPLAFRSQAYDLVWTDEAGHIRAELAVSIKSGVLPTMDTRPFGQIVVSGTPGKAREGLLWDALERGRAGRGGIVNYGASETDDLADEATWWRVHPGLASGMTEIEVIRERFEEMPLEEWAAEYAGRWPLSSSVTAIDSTAWASAGTGNLEPPARFALAADVEPNGDSAAVAAAWRDDAGKAHVMLIDAKSGSGWVPGVLKAYRRKFPKNPPAAVDGIGANFPVIEALQKQRPVVPTVQPGFRAVQGACMTLVRDLEAGVLVHSDQPKLNAAANAAVWRERDGGRVFGRKASKADVSPLVAAALALWAWDQQPQRRRYEAIVA